MPRWIGRRVRVLGGLLALATMAILLRSGGVGGSASLGIAGAWAGTLALGARWPVVRWLVLRSPGPPDLRSSWRVGALASTAVYLAACVLMARPVRPGWTVAVLVLSLLIAYVFGKLGCQVQGCCGWGAGRVRRMPLPLVEAGLAAAALVILSIAMAAAPDDRAAAALGVVLIASVRGMNRWGRRTAVGN